VSSENQENISWNIVSKVLFRTAFCFFLLYALFGGSASLLDLIPGAGAAVDRSIRVPMERLSQWVGIHLFHLTGPAAQLHIQATSDSALRWVAVAVMLAISAIATLIWSALDQRRENYRTLLAWFRLVIRLTLGVALLRYGFIKVFPIQFGPPPLAVLNEPVGNSSPTMLFWSLYGLNPTFVMTLGWTEVAAGLLLLFRKTAFLGAVFAMIVMTNVALLDISFDVPVKLYSLSLLAMAFVLLVPEMGIMTRLFLSHQPVRAVGTWGPATSRRTGRLFLLGLEVLVAVLACWQYSTGTLSVWRMKSNAMHDPASITGGWVIQGDAKGLVGGNGSQIVAIYFDPNSDTYLRAADGSLWRSRAIYDRAHQRLRILYEVVGMLMFTVEQPDADHLTLISQGPTVTQLSTLRMDRLPLPKTYPLLNHEFHWTNEFGPLR